MNINLHFNNEIRKIRENSQLRNMAESHRLPGSKIYRNGKELTSFSCNDYLGLSHNKKIISASIKAIKKYGVGAGASRLVSGNHPLYSKLENLITNFKSLIYLNGVGGCNRIKLLINLPGFFSKFIIACLTT